MTDLPNPTLAPMLGVPNAEQAARFYEDVFGARKAGPWLSMPDGAVAHAEVVIGNCLLMLADHAAGAAPSPENAEAATVRISIQVDDIDAVFEKARAAGATVLIEPSDQFYGQRAGRLQDPFGHVWVVGQPIEDVAPEEMQRRFDHLMKS